MSLLPFWAMKGAMMLLPMGDSETSRISSKMNEGLMGVERHEGEYLMTKNQDEHT